MSPALRQLDFVLAAGKKGRTKKPKSLIYFFDFFF
jgi:hypothetical protein